MIHFTRFGKQAAYVLSCIALVLITNNESFAATAPNLGTAATYGVFSGAGAIGNTGLTVVIGDIGNYTGAFTGFPPGIYTGAKHVADVTALGVKNDLTTAYNSMMDAAHAIMFDTALNATMGNGQVLTARTYGRSDQTTITGDLTFDAQDNPDAVFVVKIRAALNVAKNTRILLANGAKAANIYWAVNGAVAILNNSIFKGTILANGAIHLYSGSSLEGSALAVIGAITLASNIVTGPSASVPPENNLVVITPAPGDSVQRGTQNYQITWGGTGIAATKTFEYSLDSGATWTMIGTITADVYSYNWNVPDTASTKAIVRITDQNGITGNSGLFTITSAPTPASIVVLRPIEGEVINGGYQNFPITFTATNTTLQKTFEYSLDGGATWILIEVVNSDAQFYLWASVPNVATTQALIRITDANGVTGTSDLFTITVIPSDGSIDGLTLTGLDGNGNIGNNRTLGISWTFTPDIGTSVDVEYSLDNTITWVIIATVLVSDSPNTSWITPMTGFYNPVFVRVTSTKGMTRASAPFSIGTLTSISFDAFTSGYSVSNYPNPADNQTTINFVLPIPSDVTLTIIDGRGIGVSTVVAQHFDAGTYHIPYNTSTLPAGIYTYMLQTGATRLVGRMSLIK